MKTTVKTIKINLTQEAIKNTLAEFVKNAPESRKGTSVFNDVCFATETVLNIWAAELGEKTACEVVFTSRFGNRSIEYKVYGKPVNPLELDDEKMLALSVTDSNIFSRMGIAPEYSYVDGCNILKFWISREKKQQIPYSLSAMVLAMAVGLVLNAFAPVFSENLSKFVITPLFTILMRCLTVLAGPVIFFSLCNGIIGMDSVGSFRKTGKAIVSRYYLVNLLAIAVALAAAMPFIRIGSVSDSFDSSELSTIIDMLVNMFPPNIMSPFVAGNSIQILLLAFAAGLTILFLGNSVPDLQRWCFQVQSVFKTLLETYNKLIPLLIFSSVLSIFISGKFDMVKEILLITFTLLAALIIFEIVLILILKIRKKINIREFLKGQSRYALIALGTASSSASAGGCKDFCREKLKFDPNFVSVGVPFGQIFCKPGTAIGFVLFGLLFASYSGIDITVPTLILTLILSFILAVATPPVTGAGATSAMILLSQLGVPAEEAGIALGLFILLDYVHTAVNMLAIPPCLLMVRQTY